MVAPPQKDAPEGLNRGSSQKPSGRARTFRRSAVAIVLLAGCAGAALAAYRIVTKEIHRTNGEHRLNVHVYAPFGSFALTPGTNQDLVARLDMEADESGDDPQMYLRYGVTQNGTGNLRVSVGDEEGTLMNNRPVAAWKASNTFNVTTANYLASDNGSSYAFGPQVERQEIAPLPPTSQKSGVYTSRLYLTRELPMALSAQLGFGESYIDLTSLGLERAYIETGASKVHVVCSAPNRSMMSLYQISAGLGECTVDGVCNSNAAKVEFSGGIGYYVLNFGGQLQRDMDANVSVGLGKVTLNIPPQAGRLQVFYDDNLFSAYNFAGLTQRRSGYATSVGFDQSRAPILTLHLSSGMGKMNVVYR